MEINNRSTESSDKKTILFLHGYTQNSLIFQKRLKVLTKSFKAQFPTYQFVFPDAPFILDSDETLSLSSNPEEIKRGWLFLNESNKLDTEGFHSEKEVKYLGLEESLNVLTTIGQNNQNVEVIFAFSQGALLALFLSILISKKESFPQEEIKSMFKKYFPNLKCIVLVAGFFYPFPLNEELKFYIKHLQKAYSGEELKDEDKIDIPCLNVYGQADEFIVPEKSEKVCSLYSNVVNYSHKGKHFIPTSKDDINTFVTFIKKYI